MRMKKMTLTQLLRQLLKDEHFVLVALLGIIWKTRVGFRKVAARQVEVWRSLKFEWFEKND
jgi:hypothetical protein